MILLEELYILKVITLYRLMYFIERDQKILGQKKKLYYSGSRTWTTHYDRRKMYKTYDEANKENEQFLRDILYIHKDGRGSILSDDK